jgi:hypothetical protein
VLAGIIKKSKKQCDVSFRLLEFSDHVEFTCLGITHIFTNYLLDESNANKRNSFLRGLAQFDVAGGHAPAAVISSIRGHGKSEAEARLNAAGRAYLTRQDAINSGGGAS